MCEKCREAAERYKKKQKSPVQIIHRDCPAEKYKYIEIN
jgi:hypothetical protein